MPGVVSGTIPIPVPVPIQVPGAAPTAPPEIRIATNGQQPAALPALPAGPPVSAEEALKAMSAASNGVSGEPVRRALPLGEEPQPVTSVTMVPPPVAAPAEPPPGTEAPPQPQQQQVAMAAKATPAEELVEVGRAKDDPKLVPEAMRGGPHVQELDRPIVKNVPPACQSALTALKKFLGASNWRERLPYMQLPSEMESKAREYYSTNADGPVEVDEIEYYHHNESPQVGKGMHVVFVLRSRAWQYPMGVPVMVEVHDNEARVDWLTFVEFKDDLLNRFFTTYIEGPVRFHVGIRRTHYFEDDVPSVGDKQAFEVAPPMGNCHGFVFVPKETALARSLASTISWDKDLSLGVVELQWRKQGTQKWIEMTALPQLNWYSQGASDAAAASSAVAKPVSNTEAEAEAEAANSPAPKAKPVTEPVTKPTSTSKPASKAKR